MLKKVILLLSVLLQIALCAMLTKDELSDKAQDVLAHAGFLYKLQPNERNLYIKYARLHGIDVKEMSESKRKSKIKDFFKTNRFRYSSPRLFIIPEVMYKKDIKILTWNVKLTKLYNSIIKGRSLNPMTDFAKVIASAITTDYRPLEKYFADSIAIKRFQRLNERFTRHCSSIVTDPLFERDMDNICKVATLALNRRPNAKKIILEAVVVAVKEVLAVTPCILDSTDHVESELNGVLPAFGIPYGSTIFDPLPQMKRKLETASFKEQLKSEFPGHAPDDGNLTNALIRLQRFVDTLPPGSDVDGEIADFIATHTFARNSLLYKWSQTVKRLK